MDRLALGEVSLVAGAAAKGKRVAGKHYSPHVGLDVSSRIKSLQALLPPWKNRGCRANPKLARLEEAVGARVLVEPRAGVLLDRFPGDALDLVLQAIVRWAAGVEVTAIRVAAVSEPDDGDWEEVVFKIAIAADKATALSEWQRLLEGFHSAKDQMDERTRSLFTRNFGLHVLWGPWVETSSWLSQ